MPDQIKETKAAIEYAAANLKSMARIEIPTSTKPAVYRIAESSCSYYDTPLKMVVCYSENLESTKRQTIEKRVAKELDILDLFLCCYLNSNHWYFFRCTWHRRGSCGNRV
jgi:hypothetical protein